VTHRHHHVVGNNFICKFTHVTARLVREVVLFILNEIIGQSAVNQLLAGLLS
jgi:hypothetical protein